jgi:rhodanese-related sulfurtransferase
MQKKFYIVIIAALFALTAAVGSGAADKTSDQMVKEAKAAIKEVSVAEVKQMVDTKEKIILLDVRDKEEFETGYIPGAINISRGMLEFKVDMAIPDKNAKIIVYCGIDLRGPLATKTLNDLGYRNAVNIIGGLRVWKDAGYPVAK